MAVSVCGSMPRDARRSNVSLRLIPTSTSRRVRAVATKVQLPALEDASTDTETITDAPSLAAGGETYNSVIHYEGSRLCFVQIHSARPARADYPECSQWPRAQAHRPCQAGEILRYRAG